MSNLLTNLPHLLMATVVIAAVSVLAATGTIPGTDALVVITAAGGFSLGGAVGVAGTTPPAAPAATAATTAAAAAKPAVPATPTPPA